MEIRVLRYFLKVAQEESITRAAELLHITQPTLSRQLAQLEDELGVQLLDRSGRRISLTEQGLLLRRRAEEIVLLADKAERELSEQGALIGGRISIGCGEIASVQQLAALCAAFHERFPLVTFELFTATADQVRERMDRGLLDVGLLLEPVDTDRYDYIRMNVREEWGVLMRADDPLAERTAIAAADLAHRPLILPQRNNIQSELSRWFGDLHPSLNVLFTSNLSTNSAVMVQQGLGYSLIVRGSLPFLDQSRLVFRPLAPALTAGSVLAWRRGQPRALAASRFIDLIKCFLGMI